jgi:hypothetical protein
MHVQLDFGLTKLDVTHVFLTVVSAEIHRTVKFAQLVLSHFMGNVSAGANVSNKKPTLSTTKLPASRVSYLARTATPTVHVLYALKVCFY